MSANWINKRLFRCLKKENKVSLPRSVAVPFITSSRSFLPPFPFFSSRASLLVRSRYHLFTRRLLLFGRSSLRSRLLCRCVVARSVIAGAYVGTASVRFSRWSSAIKFRFASRILFFSLRERSRLLLSLRSSARSRLRGRASFRFTRVQVCFRSSNCTFTRLKSSRVLWDFTQPKKGFRKEKPFSSARLGKGV